MNPQDIYSIESESGAIFPAWNVYPNYRIKGLYLPVRQIMETGMVDGWHYYIAVGNVRDSLFVPVNDVSLNEREPGTPITWADYRVAITWSDSMDDEVIRDGASIVAVFHQSQFDQADEVAGPPTMTNEERLRYEVGRNYELTHPEFDGDLYDLYTLLVGDVRDSLNQFQVAPMFPSPVQSALNDVLVQAVSDALYPPEIGG